MKLRRRRMVDDPKTLIEGSFTKAEGRKARKARARKRAVLWAAGGGQ